MEATGTAGNLSWLALKGTAEPAVMVTTGWRRPVAFTGSEFLWAFAGGTAECAVKVAACDSAASETEDERPLAGGAPFELRVREFSGSFFVCEE
jgi:hypothetical protein